MNPQQYVNWSNEFFAMVREKCERIKNGDNVPDRSVGITHSSYMKRAKLEQTFVIEKDIIIVDEAQDTTPCEADLFWGECQRTNKSIYLVGDVFQQLYRFRGAGDSFERMWRGGGGSFSLTGSFRFGKNIAAYATYILDSLGGMEIVGRAPLDGEIREEDKFDTDVGLCRTNDGMYRYLYSNSLG